MPRPKAPRSDDQSSGDFAKGARLRLDLPNYVPYRISIVAALIKRSLQDIYQDDPGITEPEWKLLTTLAHYGPLPSGDIRFYVTLDRAAVSRALARLLERGFVSRRENSRDQRMFMVDLTPAAARMYDRMAKQALEVEARILERLEPGEITTLLALLNKVEMCFRDRTDRRRASLINTAIEFTRSSASAPRAKLRVPGATQRRTSATKTKRSRAG